MRQVVLFVLGILFVLCGTVYAAVDLEEGVNLIQNGDFEQGDFAPWTFSQSGTATGTMELDGNEAYSGKSSLKVTTTNMDGENWHVKPVQVDLSAEAGEVHTVKFWAKAEAPRIVQLCLQRNADPWDGWLWQDFNITMEWQEYVHEITMPVDLDKEMFIAFHVGQAMGVAWLDDVRYYRGGKDDEVVAEPVVQSVNPMDRLTSTWGGIKGNYR